MVRLQADFSHFGLCHGVTIVTSGAIVTTLLSPNCFVNCTMVCTDTGELGHGFLCTVDCSLLLTALPALLKLKRLFNLSVCTMTGRCREGGAVTVHHKTLPRAPLLPEKWIASNIDVMPLKETYRNICYTMDTSVRL